MIGTSRSATIFSKPRLKGSMLPVRLMAPSAKMQTTWPPRSSSRARRIAAMAPLAPPPPVGIARISLNSRPSSGIWKNGA